MDNIPDEVYSYLFTIVDKQEYQALTCTCKRLQTISFKSRFLLAYNSDSMTCIVKDLHLTIYQTCVLRLLLSGTKEYAIPDLCNLRRIACAYAAITEQQLRIYSVTKIHLTEELGDYPLLLQSLRYIYVDGPPGQCRIGEINIISDGLISLYLGYDSHPLYADQQRYPV